MSDASGIARRNIHRQTTTVANGNILADAAIRACHPYREKRREDYKP
jgi:hypothetical protein